jgi:hypothetical protein
MIENTIVEQFRKAREAAKENKAGYSFKAVAADDLGVIMLVGASTGSVNKVDKDNEFLEKADLVAMAHDFTSASTRTFKANHKEEIACDLVSSWVGPLLISDGDAIRSLKADEMLTSEMTVKGLGIDEDGAGYYWVLGVRPHDRAHYETAKSGGIAGASWGAEVTKVEVA